MGRIVSKSIVWSINFPYFGNPSRLQGSGLKDSSKLCISFSHWQVSKLEFYPALTYRWSYFWVHDPSETISQNNRRSCTFEKSSFLLFVRNSFPRDSFFLPRCSFSPIEFLLWGFQIVSYRWAFCSRSIFYPRIPETTTSGSLIEETCINMHAQSGYNPRIDFLPFSIHSTYNVMHIALSTLNG